MRLFVRSCATVQVNYYISERPTVTINCSSLITVDEDDDLICLCKGENGNPSPDVMWYDNKGNPIGVPGKESIILVLRSVTDEYGGTYTCKVQSYTLIEEKSIQVIVPAFNCKYDSSIVPSYEIWKLKILILKILITIKRARVSFLCR